VSVLKSARTGFTTLLVGGVAHFIVRGHPRRETGFDVVDGARSQQRGAIG
jgi:phage terminase large subunit GpA-like protein